MLRKYARIWMRLASMSLASQLVSPLSSSGYLLGKLARLAFFLTFLWAIYRHTSSLAGYTLAQAALFFLTFNLVDILAQLFFRGIYGIRGIVRDGDFDYFLIQPTNLLWRVCFSTVDFLDVITILPVFAATAFVLRDIPGAWDAGSLAAYSVLVLNGLVIAFSMHVAVAALAVWTQEMDNSIWIYRDLMTLGRFPVDIYDGWIRAVLMLVIPIAIMISVPAKAALGLLSGRWAALAFVMAGLSLTASLTFWRFACRRYTSLSS